MAALAIFLTGVSLRLYRLDGRSLWLDELVTTYPLRLRSLSEVLAYVHFWFDNMPLVFVLTWLLRGLGGSEFAVRLPFALAGAATVVGVYFLGQTVARPRVGMVAALLMAILPFAVWYSQEVRQYAFLLLFTTLQMLFAYRVVTVGHKRDWAAFAAASAGNLYTGYLAVPVTAAAYAFIGLALVIEVGRVLRARRAGALPPGKLRQTGWQLGAAIVASVAICVAYLPWLPSFRDYLSRQDWSYTGLPPNYDATLGDVSRLLATLDFSGILLLLLGVGLVTTITWAARQRPQPALLLVLWLAAPLAAFWLRLQEVIFLVPPRYFTCLFPALVLLAAIGVEGLATAGAWLGQAVSARWTTMGGGTFYRGLKNAWWAYAVLIPLVLAQALPALAESYRQSKEDYRGAAAHIIATSATDSVVLAMRFGTNVFRGESLAYYFWLHHSPIVAVEADKLDYRTAARLAHGQGTAWAAVFAPLNVQEMDQARTSGLEIIPFHGFSLLRTASRGTSLMQQAEALLRWGSAAEPRLLTSLALLRGLADETTLGPNLLPPAATSAPGQPGIQGELSAREQWVLGPGTALAAGGPAFRLTPREQEVNITFTLRRLAPGQTYLLRFRYRNPDLEGSQRVYVAAHDAALQWLDIFPGGLGYQCPPAADWERQGFAFTVPPAAKAISIWLRATGSGTAEFSAVELRQVPAVP